MSSTQVFPDDFAWGVATSAFQIEGAHDIDGREPSIWDTYAAQPGFIEDGSNAHVACDHYHRYAEDIALMKSLGVGAYRFSVAWPRILPTGRGAVNVAGLDFYDRLVDGLLAAGIAPWATLYHWDLPQALEDEGGWTSRSTVDAFVELADAVSARLGDRVEHWITHNEPWCASVLGYAQGVHAPGKRSWPDALIASHHMLLSHGRAVPVIRRNAAQSKVGITMLVAACEPASPSEADRISTRQFDGELTRWFLDPIYLGRYPKDVIDYHEREGRLPDGMRFVQPGDLEEIKIPIDFLGVNYYSRAVVRSAMIPEAENEPRTIPVPDPAELTDMGWEVYPEGADPSPHALERRLSAGLIGRHRERRRVRDRARAGRRRARHAALRLCEEPSESVSCGDRCGRSPQWLFPVVAARQLRVGLWVRKALRHRLGRFRNAGTAHQGVRAPVSSHRPR